MIIIQITGIIIVICSLITLVCWFLMAIFGGEKRKLHKEINRRIKERRDEWDWTKNKGYKKKAKTLVDVINESMKKTGGCCPGGTCDEKPKKEVKL